MTDPDPDWDPFALLLVDVQSDFWSETLAHDWPDFPHNVAALLAFCRNRGIEVVHVRARFRADGSDWMPKYRLRGRIPCVAGTHGEITAPFAVEEPGEAVVYKHTFDGFQNTELLVHLKRKGKKHLLTAGLLTSTCVLFTTASAMQNGFMATVIEDCCADEPAAHAWALDHYPFIFERARFEDLDEHRARWVRELDELTRM